MQIDDIGYVSIRDDTEREEGGVVGVLFDPVFPSPVFLNTRVAITAAGTQEA